MSIGGPGAYRADTVPRRWPWGRSYEEYENDENTKTSNMIKFNNDIVEITRKGQVDGKLIFQENQKKQSLYSTPMGDLLIEVLTKEIEVSDDDDDVNLKIKYQIHALQRN